MSNISPGKRDSDICGNLGLCVNPQTLLPSLQMLPISPNYYNLYILLLKSQECNKIHWPFRRGKWYTQDYC